MPFPRNSIPSSGSVSFGDLNAAIEWSRTRSNTRMRGTSLYSGSLVGSWNAKLSIRIGSWFDYGGQIFFWNAESTLYDPHDVLPDVEVDTDVFCYPAYYITSDGAGYSQGPHVATSLLAEGSTISGGNNVGSVGEVNYADKCGSGYSFCFVTDVLFLGEPLSITASGDAVNEDAPFLMSEFRGVGKVGRTRYREYKGLVQPITFSIGTWDFLDYGSLTAGATGATQTYTSSSIPASGLWSTSDKGYTVRISYQPDQLCGGYNYLKQGGSASATMTVSSESVVNVVWSGLGETEAEQFDEMELFIDNVLIGSAHAPGGGLDCAGGDAPVVSTYNYPNGYTLSAGNHEILILSSTNDALYHQDSYYQFTFYAQ
jgi:hypothetical protein